MSTVLESITAEQFLRIPERKRFELVGEGPLEGFRCHLDNLLPPRDAG